MSELKLKANELDDLEGYAAYLKEAVGLIPEPGIRVQLEGRHWGREIRALVGRPAQTVTLGWWEDDVVGGVCTCAAAMDCVHCLALAEHLTSGPRANGPVSMSSAAPLEKQIQ